MEKDNVENRFEEIIRKLDIILEEIELQKRHRSEMQDLKDDLTRVGKDIYDTAVLELEQVHDSMKTGDILHLFKKLLRNVNNITKTFEQLENLKDFMEVFAPVSRELFLDFMNKLNDLERKGYFEYVRVIAEMVEKVIANYPASEIKKLGENTDEIINLMKILFSKEIVLKLNNFAQGLKEVKTEETKNVTLFSLAKKLNDPEVKKGLNVALELLKSLSKQQ